MGTGKGCLKRVLLQVHASSRLGCHAWILELGTALLAVPWTICISPDVCAEEISPNPEVPGNPLGVGKAGAWRQSIFESLPCQPPAWAVWSLFWPSSHTGRLLVSQKCLCTCCSLCLLPGRGVHLLPFSLGCRLAPALIFQISA